MDKKWFSEKEFKQIPIKRMERTYGFVAFLLAFALAIAGSFAIEGYLQEKQAINTSNYMLDRIDEIRDAYEKAEPIEKIQIDIEVNKVNREVEFYKNIKTVGIISSIVISFLYLVLIISRPGYEFVYYLERELKKQEIKKLTNHISNRFKKHWHLYFNNFYNLWEIKDYNIITIEFIRKKIIFIIPDNQKLIDKFLDIQNCFKKNIGDLIVDFDYVTKFYHQGLRQGIVTVLWNILYLVVVGGIIFIILTLIF